MDENHVVAMSSQTFTHRTTVACIRQRSIPVECTCPSNHSPCMGGSSRPVSPGLHFRVPWRPGRPGSDPTSVELGWVWREVLRVGCTSRANGVQLGVRNGQMNGQRIGGSIWYASHSVVDCALGGVSTLFINRPIPIVYSYLGVAICRIIGVQDHVESRLTR